MAFGGPGDLMAGTFSRTTIRLYDPATGHTIATLEPPHQQNIDWLCIDPTGGLVVSVSDDYVQIWDLRMIRRKLADMGLDWELPKLPAEQPNDGNPVKIKVVPGPKG
jgi:WD40 repeat protein